MGEMEEGMEEAMDMGEGDGEGEGNRVVLESQMKKSRQFTREGFQNFRGRERPSYILPSHRQSGSQSWGLRPPSMAQATHSLPDWGLARLATETRWALVANQMRKRGR